MCIHTCVYFVEPSNRHFSYIFTHCSSTEQVLTGDPVQLKIEILLY